MGCEYEQCVMGTNVETMVTIKPSSAVSSTVVLYQERIPLGVGWG